MDFGEIEIGLQDFRLEKTRNCALLDPAPWSYLHRLVFMIFEVSDYH
jgi:hypothetical protein